MKHLKVVCRIGRNRSGDLRSLFLRFSLLVITYEVHQVSEIFTLNMKFLKLSSLSKRIFFVVGFSSLTSTPRYCYSEYFNETGIKKL